MQYIERREPDSREPADSLLLDDGFDTVVARPESVNERFGLGVGRRRNGKIGIPREPRFGARGDRPPTKAKET